MELPLQAIINIYEDIKRNYPLRATFADGMIGICIQIQSDSALASLKFNLMKDMLVFGQRFIGKNLPPAFPTWVTLYWTEPDHYSIGISSYEILNVPSDKAIYTIHYQLKRIQELIDELDITEVELQQWEKGHLNKSPKDIQFIYSRQPSEWTVTSLHQEIEYYLRIILKITSSSEHSEKESTITDAQEQQASDEALSIYP